ncbi:hypothetical protein R1flu_005618 [Riccia fluitans]|uniref:Pectin acetylesterase n=1 Tax=Riccia fluitans TaxID=41844 RepID=A0ABD1YUL6_9MARC
MMLSFQRQQLRHHHDRRPCSCWRFLVLLLAIHIHVNVSSGQMYGLNIVSGAQEKGAVCLDGSPPGYYFIPGFGSGLNKWIVYVEGGAWCSNDRDCAKRAKTYLGSTYYSESRGLPPTSGILSDNPGVNPDFYNWNVVWLRYCDGASFLGDRQEPVVMSQGQTIYYRGARVWDAIMQDLMAKGMASADEALLTGCSAGGLTTIHRCDSFRDIFPPQTFVKCLADAGFFLNMPDVKGGQTSASLFYGVAVTHNVFGNLNRFCTLFTAPDARWECIFAHNILPFVRTPLYILQSTTDYWQLENLIGPKWIDPTGQWSTCVENMWSCNATELSVVQEFRRRMVEDIGFGYPGLRGEFVISCPAHCMATDDYRWSSQQRFTIHGKTMQQSIGDWFYARNFGDMLLVDGLSPMNPTCAGAMNSAETKFAEHLDILSTLES